MQIVTKDAGEAVALATALNRFAPATIHPGRAPAVRGGAVSEVTKMLATSCLASSSPEVLDIAEGIASGRIQAAAEPREEPKPAKRKAKKKAKKAKAKRKAKKAPKKRK